MDNDVRKMLNKMATRCRIGWVDYSSDSYDYRVAEARLYRIRCRLRGERITLAQAIHG
ncbi:hypothetical protein [Azonexus hydrophilus]|uniref:Uncharacterized protein n=1 Tax=Azonexus hydrophilus TaxID=418702 RepID=A0ABZ2XQE7_9RHOO